MTVTDLALGSTLALAVLWVSACTTAAGDRSATQPMPPEPPVAPVATEVAAPPAAPLPSDHIATATGDLVITPVYHGTIMLEHAGLHIVVDPWSKGPIAALPKADLILLTDIHPDHLDVPAIDSLLKADTVVVGPAAVADKVPSAELMNNGDQKVVRGISIQAVPMYNLERGPEPGKLYHDKGRGNGYLLELGGKRVYLSGDTECSDEMRALTGIDVAFVCMNLPYTMPPEEAAACVKAFQPKVVYPYHYRDSDPAVFQRQLATEGAIEVRVRNFYAE